MKKIQVKVVREEGVQLPKYETEGSAGMDVRANIKEAITLKSLERVMIPTGLKVAIPEGYEIQVKVVREEGVQLPKYETEGSAGMDVRANIKEAITLKSLERVMIPTGLKVAIPEGYEIQVRPRSGLAIKHGITMLNTPGTVDSDYRGELKVIVVNLSNEAYTIEPNERIGQFVLNKVEQIEFVEVEELDDTSRGEGGFGHTGK